MGSKHFGFSQLGVCLIQSGRADQYDRFSQAALSRFSSTTAGVAAERILKICLLRDPRQSLMDSLAPLAHVAEVTTTKASSGPDAAWPVRSLTRQEPRPLTSNSPWHCTRLGRRTKHLKNLAWAASPSKTNSRGIWSRAALPKVFGLIGSSRVSCCRRRLTRNGSVNTAASRVLAIIGAFTN